MKPVDCQGYITYNPLRKESQMTNEAIMLYTAKNTIYGDKLKAHVTSIIITS